MSSRNEKYFHKSNQKICITSISFQSARWLHSKTSLILQVLWNIFTTSLKYTLVSLTENCMLASQRKKTFKLRASISKQKKNLD